MQPPTKSSIEKRVNSNIFAFSISPDGRQLALGMESAAVDVLDIERLHERPRVFSVGGRRATVTFSPDGRTFAVRGQTGGVRLLDDERGQILNMFDDQVNMAPCSMAFGAEGRLLAMAVGAEIRVLRVAPSHLDGTTVASNPGPIRRLAASSDERAAGPGPRRRQNRDLGPATWPTRANLART